MYARLRVYGSTAVAEAYRDFGDAVLSFFAHANNVQTASDQPTGLAEARLELDDARKHVRETLEATQRLLSTELAAL